MTDKLETERELKRIIEECLGAERIFSTVMTSHRDHAGEPAISIAVSMKSARDIPDARSQSELTHKLLSALVDKTDLRFPYLYFGSLDDLSGPDDVDESEAVPESSERK